MSPEKRTDELEAGDRVRLHNGLVRTVGEVVTTGWLNYQDKPIFAVMYAEGHTEDWSAGNSGIAETLWELAEEASP